MTSNPTLAERALAPWTGHECSEILRGEFDWVFVFGQGNTVTVVCPWRIIADHHIALTNTDDGQKFGLREVVDALLNAQLLLLGKRVRAVEVVPVTGDLRVRFDSGSTLELFNGSSGYEAWIATAKDKSGYAAVEQGGGNVAVG